MNSQTATPAANFDLKVTDKSFDLNVLSLAGTLPSKDIMITLSSNGMMRKVTGGTGNHSVPFGFNIVESGSQGFHDNYNVSYALKNEKTVSNTSAANKNNSVQWFGNYTLKAGTRLTASSDAFKDMIHGSIAAPDYMKGWNLSGQTTYTKNDFLKLSEAEWKEVFGETATLDELKGDSVLYYNVKSSTKISNPDLGAYLKTKLGSDAVTENEGKYEVTKKFYAETTDPNWIFGQTNYYGEASGYVDFKAGDRVTVSVVHLPSGSSMFTKTVTVQEA